MFVGVFACVVASVAENGNVAVAVVVAAVLKQSVLSSSPEQRYSVDLAPRHRNTYRPDCYSS